MWGGWDTIIVLWWMLGGGFTGDFWATDVLLALTPYTADTTTHCTLTRHLSPWKLLIVTIVCGNKYPFLYIVSYWLFEFYPTDGWPLFCLNIRMWKICGYLSLGKHPVDSVFSWSNQAATSQSKSSLACKLAWWGVVLRAVHGKEWVPSQQ